MNKNSIPILEFDEDKNAIISPNDFNKNIPKIQEKCILCFFNEIIDELEKQGKIRHIAELHSPLGNHKIYEMTYNDVSINVFNPGLGGPMAGGFVDELIGLGVKNFMACGGAGVLIDEIEMGTLIVPTSTVRDEGLSYHYFPANQDIFLKNEVYNKIESVLNENEIKFLKGKTWTTDAIYRETKTKIQNRKKQGCICVEMEFASMLSVALFRNVNFGQLLYGGDSVDGGIWKYRDWLKNESVQMKMFWLCADILTK